MPTLIPTEVGSTDLARSRSKDAMRMMEKGMSPDAVARATKIYTAGPDNWDHMVFNDSPGRMYIPPSATVRDLVSSNGMRDIMPEMLGTPVMPGRQYEDPSQFGDYDMTNNRVGFMRDIVTNPQVNHELTHAARLKASLENKKRILADRIEKKSDIPYEMDREERRAKVAENASYMDDLDNAIDALNRMYNVRQVGKNTYKSELPTSYQATRRMLSN